MNRIENIIVDYCQETNPKYALLIDGSWGEGKTHFLKNNIANKIKDKKSLVYVSLNGVRDVEEIKRLILEAKIPLLQNKKLKFVGSLASSAVSMFSSSIVKGFFSIDFSKFFNSNKIDVNSLMTFENTVVCFDDLERVSSQFEIEDVLGFINTNFIEHKNVNTIIVCDVEKIDKNKSKEKSFDVIKEKLIGRTLKFSYTEEEVVQLFKDDMSLSSDTKRFYNENEEIFKNFFQLSGIKNLRTVYFISDNFKRIIPCINNADSETVLLLINFTCIVASEFKLGLINRTKDFYVTDLKRFNYSEYMIQLRNEMKNKSSSETPEQPVVEDHFNKIYGKLNYRLFETIYDFIIYGLFVEISITQEIKDINSDILNKRDKPEYNLLNNIRNWGEWDEKGFNDYVQNIKTHFENGSYTLYVVVSTISEFFYSFVYHNLLSNLNISTFEELDEYLSKTVKTFVYNEEEKKDIHFLNRLNSLTRKDLIKTSDAIANKRDAYNKIIYKDSFEKDLILIKENLEHLYKIQDRDPFEYLFANMNAEDLSEFVLEILSDHSKFIDLKRKLNSTFNYSNAGHSYYKYKEIIDNLIIQLTPKIEDIADKISKYHLNDFVEMLQDKSRLLESTKNK